MENFQEASIDLDQPPAEGITDLGEGSVDGEKRESNSSEHLM